ncbi:MAG: peroxiredoxin [Proteobacteria bacterium]|nr:MAG: peroxiredoxin [Pseudomonadota bacterium]
MPSSNRSSPKAKAAPRSARPATRKPESTAARAPAPNARTGRKVALDKKVPAFALPATGGKTWKLADAAGKKLVVYFYPRDNTPGCTREGEAFRDLYPAFKRAGTLVVGISPDSIKSHEKFREAFAFPFDLLSDETRAVCELFDVIKEKSLYGRKYMGVERSTFLIDERGVLRREWRKVKVPGHAEEVLAAAKAL